MEEDEIGGFDIIFFSKDQPPNRESCRNGLNPEKRYCGDELLVVVTAVIVTELG